MASPEIFIGDDTVYRQRLASSPRHSAWVSANAGSGKTTVLSNRVVRLLLSGTDPSRILCLTFTKAAAGEMSNRVFKILGQWATIPEDQLREELFKVEGTRPTDSQLETARTLFARALETPGGLKIQTIHAFCEALLHQFPLEANIPGNFSVMDDSLQVSLMNEARRQIILETDAQPNSALAHAFSRVMAVATDAAIEKTIGEVIAKRDELANWLLRLGGPESAEAFAKQRFQFSPDDDEESATALAADESLLSTLDLAALAQACTDSGKSTMEKLALSIQTFVEAKEPTEKLDCIAAMVLTAKGDPRSFAKYPTKEIHEKHPEVREVFAREAERVVSALLRINTLKQIVNTTPLLVIAEAMIERYRHMKRQQGLLDFDDLVFRTADLLTRKSARSWVLYKLDLGIDHILLDEAQDTSPRQWQIINAMVEEFFSGDSARSISRTVFAVGDEKQSIYSFQGAEPESFDLTPTL